MRHASHGCLSLSSGDVGRVAEEVVGYRVRMEMYVVCSCMYVDGEGRVVRSPLPSSSSSGGLGAFFEWKRPRETSRAPSGGFSPGEGSAPTKKG